MVLDTVGGAVAAGLAHRWAAALWGVSDDRVHRWRARRAGRGASLEDRRRAVAAAHALLAQEVEAILEIAERWGPTDRSHPKLAHRGSYENLVWVSPSAFRRVLDPDGLIVAQASQRRREPRRPWPSWLVWEPNRIPIWDVTHFGRARRCVFAIVDMVSRRWISTVVSPEESSTQARVALDDALAVEGLTDLLTDERLDLPLDDPRRPILLAVSDNGGPMVSAGTRAFMAAVAIAQHHGRPRTTAGPAPPPTRPGSRASSATSKANGHTSATSPTPPCQKPSCTEPAATTTTSDSTKPSAASPPTTNTTAAHKPSAKPANKAHNKPARTGSTTTAGPLSTTPTRPNDTVDSKHDPRGKLRHTSHLTPHRHMREPCQFLGMYPAGMVAREHVVSATVYQRCLAAGYDGASSLRVE